MCAFLVFVCDKARKVNQEIIAADCTQSVHNPYSISTTHQWDSYVRIANNNTNNGILSAKGIPNQSSRPFVNFGIGTFVFVIEGSQYSVWYCNYLTIETMESFSIFTAVLTNK